MITLNDNKKSIIHELLMGKGKTYVIIPCVIFYYMLVGNYTNIISCLPSHLINQSMSVINKLNPYMINSIVVRVLADRTKENNQYIDKLINNNIRKIIIIDDISLKSYFLTNVEYNIKVSDVLMNDTLLIIDEYDSIVDPLKSDLNYPIDKPENINEYNFLNNLIISITKKLFSDYSDYMYLSDRLDEIENKKILKTILNGSTNNEYKSLIDKIQNKEQYEQFQSGGSKDDLLVFYIREVYKSYLICMKMMLDKDYGWNNLIDKNDSFIVIPFSAQKTPISGSKFSNPLIAIILTTITYFAKPFRETDSIKFIEYIFNTYKKYSYTVQQISEELTVDRLIIFYAYSGNHDGLTKHMIDIKNTNYIEYEKFIHLYLNLIIFPKYIKFEPKVYNCSFLDIIDPHFIKSKIAISGTVNIHIDKSETDYILSNIKGDEKTQKIIVDVLNPNIETKILDITRNDVLTSIIELMNEYNVLIDVGSFLRNYENKEVAKQLSNKYSNISIVYFNENNQLETMLNMSIVTNKNLKYDILTKVYFDQKHTIGTDLDLHSLSHGLITVNSANRRTELVQGIFRLREINLDQKITFLTKDSINTNKILENINNKEDEYFKQSRNKFYEQTLLCEVRQFNDYHQDTYIYKSFIPSSENINSNILKKYLYDFKKNHFITNIDNDTINLLKDRKKIKNIQKINKYKELLREEDYKDEFVMIQKETAKETAKETLTIITNNNLYVELPEYINYYYCTYIDNFKPPTYLSNKINYRDTNNNTLFLKDNELIKYLDEYDIYLSPSAAYSIATIYNDNNSYDIFYFHEEEKKLYTSLDKILFFTDDFKDFVIIDNFITDQDDPNYFIKNIIMFLSYKNPSNDIINKFIENKMIDNDLKRLLRNHYKNIVKSKQFTEFLTLYEDFTKIIYNINTIHKKCSYINEFTEDKKNIYYDINNIMGMED